MHETVGNICQYYQLPAKLVIVLEQHGSPDFCSACQHDVVAV